MKFWFGAAVLAIAGAVVAIYAMTRVETRVIQSDGVRLSIPLRFVEDESPLLSLLSFLPGLDRSSREVLLTIGAFEVAEQVPRFQPRVGSYNDDLRLRLTFLTDSEVRRFGDPHRFEEIAKSVGSYGERIIEFDSSRDFARVYRKVEYPLSWEVFRVPSASELPADLASAWVAHCLRSDSPLTESGQLALCKGYVVIGNIAVHFTISDENLSQAEEIKAYVRRLVSDWQRRAMI